MAWSRGFFRIWIVAGLIWCVYVLSEATSAWDGNRKWLITSELCAQFTTRNGETLLPYELDEVIETRQQVKFPHAVRVSIPDVISCERENWFRAHMSLLARDGPEIVGMLLAPPLVLLGLGAILGWVLSGFLRKEAH